ncbi:hypothetical protein F4778DRAFT_383962 [Xylariomycetidae sp. FL2044]|nr:hypothetical protein F4778DRAFT_383962 [Xylariomycetidae sp. FL2044]
MALSRSASGPAGGLSTNTASANMFGSSTAQPPAGGGLFGSTAQAQTSQPSTASGLFGNPSTAKPASSLFANASTATPSQPQQTGGGLFGGANTTTSQPQSTPSLFGNPSQPQSTTPSLFGNPSQSSGMLNTAAPKSGGLFGASTAGQTPAANTIGQTGNVAGGSSLFGGQPAQSKTGLFGGLNQSTQNQSNSAGQPQQSTMGFGSSLGIGLTMGQPGNQQTVPGVRIDISNLKGTTRFNDLQEDLQKNIEKVDEFIQAQKIHHREVSSFMPRHGEMLENVPNDVKFVSRKYDGARNALETAAQAIESARILVNQDADHARLNFRAIDNLKLPQQYHTAGIWSPRQQAAGTADNETDRQDLVGLFSRSADGMGAQLQTYEKNLTEIETHMHGVSDNLVEQLQRMMASKGGAPGSSDEKINELVAVLRDFEQGILKVASDVGGAREGMTRLQLGDFLGYDNDRNGVY